MTLSGEDPVTIVVRLPEHQQDIRLTGRVQRVLGEGAVHRIGVVFDEAAQPFCETMRQYAALAAEPRS